MRKEVDPGAGADDPGAEEPGVKKSAASTPHGLGGLLTLPN